MSFVVRRVGGGTFNPNAMCVSHDGKKNLFIGCGSLINIYTLPDLSLNLQITSHKARVTCLACSDDFLISGDSDGYIMIHNFNMISIIDQKPSEVFHHKKPIEKIFIRSSKIFIVYFKKRMFWVAEYSYLKSESSLSDTSLFIVDDKTQKMICDIHDSLVIHEPTWLRFPQRDNFDIDETGTVIIVSDDDCQVRVFDLSIKKIIDSKKLSGPCRICRFRNDTDYFVFMQNGKYLQFGELNTTKHWHFVCPNAVCFDQTSVYSGGAEGVFISFNANANRLFKLPRIGMTIEGLAISEDSQYIAGVVDKNILVSIDPKANRLLKFVSHIYGDIFFNGNIITSLRRPNLIQFFNSKTADCIEQLSVSSYNCRVPVTSFALANDYLITVETSEGEDAINYNEIGYSNEENFEQEGLTMALQAEFNHTKPHGDISASNEIYRNMLTRRRFDEFKSMLKMRYGADIPKSSNELNSENQSKTKDFNSLTYLADINFDLDAKTVEGNPLLHVNNESSSVGYSEVKIWSNKNASSFTLDQTFRIIGKKVSPLSMHPVLHFYAMIVAKELQLWRLSNKWQLWKSTRLGYVPEKLIWSPDGSILILQFTDRLEVFDIESFDIIFTKMFESAIVESSFLNDSMMVVHSKDGIALFDLRKLSVTKRIFAQAECCSSKDGCVAFVTNKNQPIVVLMTEFDIVKKDESKKENDESISRNNKKNKRSKKSKSKDVGNEEDNNKDGSTKDVHEDMKCWELPTTAKVKALNINKDDKDNISIIAIDDCNFIWMIDEYGIAEVQEERIKQITPVKPKEVEPQNRVEIEEDKSKLILDLINIPSHQIPQIDDLCAEMFGLVIEKRDDIQLPATIAINEDEIGEEIEEVKPLNLSPQDKEKLRLLFAAPGITKK